MNYVQIRSPSMVATTGSIWIPPRRSAEIGTRRSGRGAFTESGSGGGCVRWRGDFPEAAVGPWERAGEVVQAGQMILRLARCKHTGARDAAPTPAQINRTLPTS